MEVVCFLSIIAVAALLFYSICRAPSRACHPFEQQTLVFLSPSAAAPFEDLLAAGDVESIWRILKALEQRGDLLVFSTGKEIYIDCPEPRSRETRPGMTPAGSPLPPSSLRPRAQDAVFGYAGPDRGSSG
jgi:hypothetical protein